MLTISKPLSASQAQTYHAKEFTAAEQNYWKQGDTIQGEWHGKLAPKFGLAGAVGAEQFARLSEGRHPETGEQLVRHRNGQGYTTADGTVATNCRNATDLPKPAGATIVAIRCPAALCSRSRTRGRSIGRNWEFCNFASWVIRPIMPSPDTCGAPCST